MDDVPLGLGTKENQEATLALRLKREGFEAMLAEAVAPSFGASGCATQEDWAEAVKRSDVRLQWDPDPALQRPPAVQLSLRGEALRRLNGAWLLDVEDISGFGRERRTRFLNVDWRPLGSVSDSSRSVGLNCTAMAAYTARICQACPPGTRARVA
ncbi:DUF4291 family protein [Deinococcus hopiensis]|uniref:DUF4291 family protein n=1 Tax=Deinococcus hopiensis TaxID=309885 RepID=UPI001BAE683D|nr:DUF4291 family protein [Deinococcus hopiensis]